MKCFLIFNSLLLYLNLLIAQQSLVHELIENKNFKEIQSIIRQNSFLVSDTTQEGGNYASYLRWMNFWASRVGGINDTATIKGAHNTLLSTFNNPMCLNNTNTPLWNSLGPFQNSPHTGGIYPNMGVVWSVAVDPNNHHIIYAGTNASGLWRCNLSQTPIHWQNITDNTRLPGLGINHIAIDPSNSNVIYISTGMTGAFGYSYGIGILKTIDGGVSWQNISPSLPNSPPIMARKVVINPLRSQTIYAIINDDVYRSYNGGNTWQLVFSLSPTPCQSPYNLNDAMDIADIEMLPSDTSTILITTQTALGAILQYMGCLGPGSNCTGTSLITGNNGAFLYITQDGGNTWNQIIPETGGSYAFYISSAVTNSDSNYFYIAYKKVLSCAAVASCYTGFMPYIKKIDRYGNIVSSIVPNYYYCAGLSDLYPAFEISPYDKNKIAIGDLAFHLSNDNGSNFLSIYSYYHIDVRSIYFVNNDTIIMGNDGGVSMSIDGGNSWIDINGYGLNITQFYGIGVSEITGDIVGGTQDNSVFLYKNNQWYGSLIGADGGECIFDKKRKDTAYIETWCCCNACQNLYLMNTSTLNYSFIENTTTPLVRKAKIVNDTFFIGYNNLRYKKLPLNNTTTDLSQFPGQTSGTGIKSFDVFDKSTKIIYVLFQGPSWDPNTCGHYLFKSTDGGNNWIDITSNLCNSSITDISNIPKWIPMTQIILHPEDSNKIWLTLGAYETDYSKSPPYNGKLRVIRSTDGGLTWSDYSNNLPPFPVNCIVYEKGSDGGLYVGTDVGVFYTNNKIYPTQGWICFNNGLPTCIVTDLEINYAQNKIYAATFGRGVWVSDLYCPPDYDINIHSANYAQYNHQFNEAENNIYITTSGSSYVLNNFTARAGNEIVITPTANDEIILDGTGNGTHLFIHPCNHPGNSFRQSVTSKRSTDDYPVVPEMINGSMMKSISGLDEKHNHIAYLYPNPTDEHVHIDVKDNAIIEKILLKDLTGKTLLQKESNSSSETLDISHLSNGLYFVVVQTTAGTYTEKLIVRHE